MTGTTLIDQVISILVYVELGVKNNYQIVLGAVTPAHQPHREPHYEEEHLPTSTLYHVPRRLTPIMPTHTYTVPLPVRQCVSMSTCSAATVH